MKKMTFEEFYGMGWKNRWQAFNALQTELETRGQGMGVDLPNFEDALESAFWEFDAKHKATSGPSERDAFKQVLRGLFSAGLDPESRGLRAELLARRMEVESQSRIIHELRSVHQGFVVDLDVFDGLENGLVVTKTLFNEEQARGYFGQTFAGYIPRPLPPKVERARTREELMLKYAEYICDNFEWRGTDNPLVWQFIAEQLDEGKKLDDLCTAANIPLTVLEEV